MSESTKEVFAKILAIFGFCVTVALIIWLIITAIGRAPHWFASLASVADSVNLRKETSTLEVSVAKSVVNSGEPFDLSWTDTNHAGAYRLGYACADGVTIFFKDPENVFRPMKCGDQFLSLPADLTSITLVASSTKDRFTDVNFRVLFAESTSTTPIEGTAKVTVVNAKIAASSTSTVPAPHASTTSTHTSETPAATSTTHADAGDAPTRPCNTNAWDCSSSVDYIDPLPMEGEVPSSSATPAPVHSTPVYTYPQSNPNGYTDLAVTVESAGAVGAYEQYTVTFTIKNIGTKTSGAWSFNADLPGGEDYTSMQYAPLKPQEYMTFTLSAPLPGYTYAAPRATITAVTSGDANLGNNTVATVRY